jgi:HEAT repeat protein
MADPNPASQRELNIILSELRDTNKEKRRQAVMRLGMMRDDQAVGHLIRVLENDFEDVIVRGKAALMLGKVGDERAVLPLIKALAAPGYQTPLHAVESLGLLGDVRAIQPLVSIADQSKDRLHDAAIHALRRLGYEYPHALIIPTNDEAPIVENILEPQPEL